MAQKPKPQPKPKPPKEKVQRFVPNINLLKNVNAIFLVAGFGLTLLTVSLLSHNTNDIRTRANPPAEPTLTPIPTLCPAACPSVTPKP
jgi:hypothetical protein